MGTWVLWTLTAPFRLVERARGNRRLALIGMYGLIAGAIGVLSWRQTSLRGLPDVGDPFDVAAFVGREVSQGDDAFEAFGDALELLDDRDLIAMTHDLQDARKADWAVLSPALRSWVDRNRRASERWKVGAERSSGNPPWMDAEDLWEGIERVDRLVSFNYLALMEGARLEGEGDLAVAWEWYRALMRAGFHLQRGGGYGERLRGMSSVSFASEEMQEWAADPRVDGTLLRRALADEREAGAMAVPNSETLKAEYVRVKRTLDEPWRIRRSVRREDPRVRHHGWQDADSYWYRYLPGYLEARWWLMQEPERSRRVARIAYANWLAHCDGVTAFRPPQAGPYPGLFTTAPQSPAEAFAYPSELYDWLESSLLWDAGIRQPSDRDNWRRREDGRMATLLVTLAREAYRREHDGREAPTLDALVGPYLDRLPVGYAEPDEAISQGEQ